MKTIIGIITVLAATLVSYHFDHGKVEVLWKPLEFAIILGAAFGAFIIGNPPSTLKRVMQLFPVVFKKEKYNKQSYIDLLSVLYQTFRLAKTKGMLALEAHIEKPEDSSVFQAFPSFLNDHHAVEFFCDYLRLITLGSDKAYELEVLIDQEIELHHYKNLYKYKFAFSIYIIII